VDWHLPVVSGIECYGTRCHSRVEQGACGDGGGGGFEEVGLFQGSAGPDEAGGGDGLVDVVGEQLVDGDAVQFSVSAPLMVRRQDSVK
jgi:hypothetical protein